VSLFTVTAYAMGWFGLRERMIESAPKTQEAVSESASPENSTAPTAEPKRWVSLNGYADSPEYLANAEWLRFREEYLASHTITNDNSWMDGLDEETVNTCRYYGVYDRAMLDKLNALAEQYGLRLHTHQVTPLTLEDFYRAAGTGAFLTDGSGSGYIYEDGSFKLETNGSQDRYLLSILKNLSGTILPLSSGMDRPENYEEWEYTNTHGDTVLMAFNEHREDIDVSAADLRIFFDADGVFIMAHAGFYDREPVTKDDCEAIADRIMFHELVKTEPDFSVLYVDPTVAEDPGEAATLADFLTSPEGQAARAWSQASNSRRGTEAGQRELASLRPGIVEKFGVLDYTQYWEVDSQTHIDSGLYRDSPFPAINYDEFAEKGYDRRIAEMFYMLGLQDNGVILGYKSMLWIYIPFGSFCDYTFDLTADSYTDEWFYRTDCGAVVTLCADFGDTSTAPPVVICRTAKGWLVGRGNFCHNAYELEGWADEIDYTLFP
ncbi:MAG: hypothetical protein IIY43_13850, partial [Oscillospiraceae bacterium]|nr:hypothetical protein [Oscillospiraceae bacterium]